MKKFIAKEILSLISTSAIFGIIILIGWLFQPKEIKLNVSATDFIANPRTYSNTQEAYLAAWNGEPLLIASENYKTRLKEYDNNRSEIDFYWSIITITEIILISFVYPLRGLYHLIKWSLNTLKNN